MSDTTYLTAEGAEKLKEELANLKGPKREEIAARLRLLSNREIYRKCRLFGSKEDQSFVKGEFWNLKNLLANVKIIDNLVREHGVVNIGSTVTIQEENFEPEVYMIVGSQEADPFEGKISFQSPIGSALYLKHVGDIVTAETRTVRLNLDYRSQIITGYIIKAAPLMRSRAVSFYFFQTQTSNNTLLK